MQEPIIENESKILEDCNDFLQRSSKRYSEQIERALVDMRRYSGEFWDDGLVTEYKRKKRQNLSINNWSPLANAIASPVSNSPWHIELVNKTDASDIQESIDTIEADSEAKSAMIDGFRKSVLTGYGYIVLSTVQDEFTGEAKISVESAHHLDAIAFDPSSVTVDGSDAEEGAIINWLSLKKAKRLYGTDIVPLSYPSVECTISFSSKDQWEVPEDSVAEVTYYVKNEEGFVDYYKIVGNRVIAHETLPIKYIPIIRFAGNEIYRNGKIDYNGIIRQTMSLEIGANIAYSSLIERVGRSAKANIMAHVDAIDGLERNMAAINQDDSVAVLWKGEHQPVILTESFETGDLQNTISTCRTLEEDTLGIPLTGIVDKRERTATEILRQEVSKESNTANYYNHAYTAMRTFGKIIIELMNGGTDLQFTLENGPSVITRQMKQRQELTALSTILPDNMKPIIAKYFADTLKDDVGEDLSRNIVANLPPDVRFVPDDMDPAAIHQLNQMKFQMDETMAELEKKNSEVQELKNQLLAAQLSLVGNREKNVLDWQKFQIAEKDKMMIEAAKLGTTEEKNQGDQMLKAQEVSIKAAEVEMKKQEGETQAYIEGAQDMLDKVIPEQTIDIPSEV